MKISAGNRLGFIEQDGSSAWRTSDWLLCKQAQALTARPDGGAVAFGRAKRGRNPGSSVAGCVVIAISDSSRTSCRQP